MVINMDESRLRTIEQIQAFLEGNAEVTFTPFITRVSNDDERYAHIARVLQRFDYPRRSKPERGVLLHYLRTTSGYSKAQMTRLVGRWQANRLAAVPLQKRYSTPKAPFARRYSDADIALLVEVDRSYEDICGLSTLHVCKRAYEAGDTRFERLASLSTGHLYNLRKSSGYQRQRASMTKTQAAQRPIGVRQAPRTNGRAGYVRIDSVHQGDQDGRKGVYHITCVDEQSQYHIQACVQGISHAYLLPVLASILAQFPFVIKGFHSDNGSEYINKRVADMLNTLLIEQTKSRARHSNDNALAESKNASVVRKHMGYSHIPAQYAGPINAFYQEFFNPWLNMHRPCLFASETVNAKGKTIKRYERGHVKTPLEALALLDRDQKVTWKKGVSLVQLQQAAAGQTDLQATQAMQRAKAALFESFRTKKRSAQRA